MTTRHVASTHAPKGARWRPGPRRFADLHRAGATVAVRLDMPDPGWDPCDLSEALPVHVPVYLFETAGGPPDLERRTFLAWDPEREFVLRRGDLEVRARGRVVRRRRARQPLVHLRRALEAEGATAASRIDATGFSGGLVGWLSYDFKNYLERLPDTARDDLELPELRFGLVRRVVVWDRRRGEMSLRCSLKCSGDVRADLQRARKTLLDLYAALQAAATSRKPARRATPAGPLRSNVSRAAYDAMLARAHEHIMAGDLYQANLSHRFEARFAGRGIDLYRRLRAINPSPFACWLRFPEYEIVSCSPERLVKLERGRVETRPIAGTRPRGADVASDQRLHRELRVDTKERAEHLMIVDMARNDIGRVCEAGSVAVERFMHAEGYSHVRHLVTNVVGKLRPDRDAFDVLAATFPGASITGVPKVRCMQIIDALEQVRRGVYTGSAGYIGFDGAMDFNILIRTFLLRNGRAYFHVGGGIVADSDPEREFQETLSKGRALAEALGSVHRAARGRA